MGPNLIVNLMFGFIKSDKYSSRVENCRNPLVAEGEYVSQLSIEMSMPSGQSERSCTCVLRVSILPLSTIVIFDFEIVLTVWYFLFSLS
jgi:hypothetical protein